MSFEQKPTTPFHSMDEPSSLCNISTEVCDKKFEHIGGPSEYVSKSSTVAKNYGCNCCQHRQMTQDEGKVEECQKNNSTRQIPMTKNRPQHLCIPHPTIDHNGLSWPAQGTLQRKENNKEGKEECLTKISCAVKTILECIGEDPEREGLLDTPARYAKAILFFTKGYEEELRDIVNGALFHEGHHEMVVVQDIDFSSLCEHHLVPFRGKMHIGYIPKGEVIGLSKIPRIVEMFSRRLQVQERLTKQIGSALFDILQPQGVAVVVQSSHLCMEMRGVQKNGAVTTTYCMLGILHTSARTREEFLNLIN